MSMIMYYDCEDLPKKSHIVTYLSPCIEDFDEWMEWVKKEGEILLEVICDDGVVIIVRVEIWK